MTDKIALGIGCCWAFLASASPTCADDATKGRFLGEYPAAAAALEASANRDGKLKVVRTKTTSQSTSETVGHTREEFTLWKSGPKLRVDMKFSEDRPKPGEEAAGVVHRGETCLIAAEGRVVSVGRSSLDGPYKFIFDKPAPAAPYIEVTRDVLLHAATTMEGRSIAESLQDPGFTVVDATERAEDGRPIVEVSFRKATAEGKPAAAGTMRFDPARGWALVGYVYQDFGHRGGPATTRIADTTTRITYADDPEGLSPPFPASIEGEGGAQIGENQVVVTRRITFEPFEPGPIPEREFTLAGFGVTEP